MAARSEVRTCNRRSLRAIAAAHAVPARYAAACVSYVALGVCFTSFMLSWVVFFAWLLLWVWALAALAARIRR
jgi:ABC-type multidrug transport system permease subunit